MVRFLDDRPGATAASAAQAFLDHVHGRDERAVMWVDASQGLFRAGASGVKVYRVALDGPRGWRVSLERTGERLGFAEAETIRPGDRVVYGGAVQEVVEIAHRGKDWPYFIFANHDGEWHSWQLCGSAQ